MICSKCKLEKSEKDFNKTNTYMCKSCHQQKSKKWYHRFPKEFHIGPRREKKYGISVEEYAKMLEKQNNGCAICGREDSGRPNGRNLYVDHDHQTNKIRGLLCDRCNKGLGWFQDNPDYLIKASNYVSSSL